MKKTKPKILSLLIRNNLRKPNTDYYDLCKAWHDLEPEGYQKYCDQLSRANFNQQKVNS